MLQMKKGKLFYVAGSYPTFGMQVKLVYLFTSRLLANGIFLGSVVFLLTSASPMSRPNLF